MSKKLFLTSAIAIGFVANAYAEPTNTGEFPQDGLMQEDYTYTNAANSDNMDGVYEGTVNAEAEYENILYNIAAGQYLPAAGETVIACNQPGSFCPGVNGTVTYDANNAQGLTSCSTATNGDFTSSDGTGTSADSCYRTCNVNNMGQGGSIATIAHATALTGNDYYGNGTDTCVPSACENGWHVHTPNLTNVIGENAGTGYTSNDSNGDNYDTDGMSNTIIAGDEMAFAVDYGNNGMVKGHGRCSTQGVTNIWYDNNYTFESDHFTAALPDSTGQYCYCHLDEFTPLNGSAIALSGPWVFYNVTFNADSCATSCAGYCTANLLGTDSDVLAFRAAVFGAYPSGPAQCSANTITINWLDVDQQYAGQNNEGTAVYGGNINTPFKAATKPGQRFTGWRFSTPTPVSVGD